MQQSIVERLYTYWHAKLIAMQSGQAAGTQTYTTTFNVVTEIPLSQLDQIGGEDACAILFLGTSFEEMTNQMTQLVVVQLDFSLKLGRDESPTTAQIRVASDLYHLFMSDRQSGPDQLSDVITPVQVEWDDDVDVTDRIIKGVMEFNIVTSHDTKDPAVRR